MRTAVKERLKNNRVRRVIKTLAVTVTLVNTRWITVGKRLSMKKKTEARGWFTKSGICLDRQSQNYGLDCGLRSIEPHVQ